ncbi:MAG: aminotransferase class I and II [Bacteroidetes bacterium]|nr:MAG: aminotransferase class I and II [Bacteroidota bacterium]
MTKSALRTVTITRYIAPLREGGSLPALAEADDDFKYVLKFNGSGHGTKVLIAELIGGEIARAIGLRMPELVFANLHEAFGQTEADEEIQDLLKASTGLNLALHFLSGAINFDPAVKVVEPLPASKIVWLDAFITNVDRTFKNTNMLIWNKELWLIDHGASFYFHHSGTDWEQAAKTPFGIIKSHVLLPQASLLQQADEAIKQVLTQEKLTEIIALIPSEWLVWTDTDKTPEELREVYLNFLTSRLSHTQIYINEAQHARETLI